MACANWLNRVATWRRRGQIRLPPRSRRLLGGFVIAVLAVGVMLGLYVDSTRWQTPPEDQMPLDLAFVTVDGRVFGASVSDSRTHELTSGLCKEGRVHPQALALAPDGRFVAAVCQTAGTGRTLAAFDLALMRQRIVSDQVIDIASSIAWSPDSRLLAFKRPEDLGPAPSPAQSVWVYRIADDRVWQIDEPRFAIGPLIWELDSSALMYRVNSWLNGPDPVAAYRAPVDGSGAALWREDVEPISPGPAGQWLVERQRHGSGPPRSEWLVIEADGRERTINQTSDMSDVITALGWLNDAPVVWRETVANPWPTMGAGPLRVGSRGEIWSLGDLPRRHLVDVPIIDVRVGWAALAANNLLYVDGDSTLWLADLTLGVRSLVAREVADPVAIRQFSASLTNSEPSNDPAKPPRFLPSRPFAATDGSPGRNWIQDINLAPGHTEFLRRSQFGASRATPSSAPASEFNLAVEVSNESQQDLAIRFDGANLLSLTVPDGFSPRAAGVNVACGISLRQSEMLCTLPPPGRDPARLVVTTVSLPK